MSEKVVQIPASKVYKMMAAIERLEKQSSAANMISEDEAAALLGITTRTLKNKYYKGEVNGMFTISPVNNERFYYKDKILGLQ